MTYKFVTAIKTKKDVFQTLTCDKLVQFVKKNPVAYESLIDGNYIPYYDFDFKYATEKEQKEKYDENLITSCKNVHSVYDNANDMPNEKLKIFTFDSSGYDPTVKLWKNSFHYRIRGAGYYEKGTDIPTVEGTDNSVYKRKGSRQLMRMAFCTKRDNQRPLLRIIPETKKKYKIDEIKALDETISDYVIQNIEGEVKCKNAKDIAKQQEKEEANQKKEHEKKKRDELKNDEAKYKIEFTVDNIDNLCKCLSESRFNDRKEWLRFIRCLKNISEESNINTENIAHKYSSISDKYDKAEVKSFFSQTHDILKINLNIGSLFYWAKCDNFTMYEKLFENNNIKKKSKILILLNKSENAPLKYSFPDYRKFINAKIKDEYEIIKYLHDTVIHIIDGGNHKLFTRSTVDDGSTRFVATDINLFKLSNNFNFAIGGKKTNMYTYFLNNYYHAKCYDVIDFIPYLNKNPVSGRTFNLFQGFQYNFKKMDVSQQPKELELMFYHLEKVICGSDAKVYRYMMNYITHMFQRPDEKIGVAVLLQSDEHGTGKNRFTDFLMNVLGLHNVYKANKMEDVCASFNYHMQGKLLIIGDEIANYASHKFADLLKALITEVTKAITPKGKDSYVIKTFERYMFTSNNDLAFRAETGDRRLLALKVAPIHVKDTNYFTKLSKIVDSPKMQELFFNYMASQNIADWDFRDIPVTSMKSDLIEEGLSPTVHFIIDMMNKCTNDKIVERAEDLFTKYKEYCDTNSHKKQSERKFIKELKKIKIEKKKIQVNKIRNIRYALNKSTIEKTIRDMTGNANFKFDTALSNSTSGLNTNDPFDSDDED